MKESGKMMKEKPERGKVSTLKKYQEVLAKVRKANPSMSFREQQKKASEEYKKLMKKV